MEPTANSSSLRCVIVTPERAVLDETCDFIAVPMFDGELGVAPGRLPLIGRLGFGELRIKKRGITARYYVDGGFVQIRQNAVTVLTQKAIKGEEIQIPAAEAALKAAQTPAADAGTQEARLKAQQRARAQIRVAHHATDKPGLSLEGH
jgi:F-type H+-transporting ATPase subunit epsilon